MEKHSRRQYPSVKKIDDKKRIEIVQEIFSTVTGKYDFLNHFLSLRRDIAWRRFAVRKMNFFNTGRFLDVATGTGDLAIDAAIRYPEVEVTGVDFVPKMMERGEKKIAERGLANRVHLLQGDALELPFPDNHFDVAGMAFGIRNIPDKKRALQEMLRVVVPGGQVMILEMTFPTSRFFQGIYHIYLNKILPRLARLFSKNPDAYYYLADSIMNFPTAPEFAALMEESGCISVSKHPLTLGITYLHIGIKPEAAAHES